MELNFKVGNIPEKLTRGWFFGSMKVITPGGIIWLQHPLSPSTHCSFQTKSSWEVEVEGQKVRVEKIRPLMMGGLRGCLHNDIIVPSHHRQSSKWAAH
ncbi:hypothetical protein ACCQ13_09940 [Xanthomonas sp. NCPPB 1638]|uniref:hypothetical protein n=1 Tax=Xanthomonas TaxID=338 RepID=UPI001331C228|nr:hypothetical protein [Xanthomonas cucurbitae]WDM77177.1 hypothetical protein K6982_09775 [Xanthomonas cucurbitae]